MLKMINLSNSVVKNSMEDDLKLIQQLAEVALKSAPEITFNIDANFETSTKLIDQIGERYGEKNRIKINVNLKND